MLYVIDYLFLVFWINDMNENISKNKHMTADQRNEIFTMLENGDSVSKIASAISKDKSTVSKEIRKHRIEQRISNALSKMAPALMLKAAHVPIYALISNAISSFVKSVTSVKAFVLISSFIYVSD